MGREYTFTITKVHNKGFGCTIGDNGHSVTISRNELKGKPTPKHGQMATIRQGLVSVKYIAVNGTVYRDEP